MLNLDKKKKYLLACSFGPDSMALFKMLLDNGYSFSVAHVNYHLRKESDDEMNNLKDYCQKNNVKLYFYNVKEKIDRNVEEKCREIRYRFFSEAMKENKDLSAILIAHHQDDLLETYLLQKRRKILPQYYGLHEKTIINGFDVIRPLLCFKKSDLLKFCRENNVPFSIDSTNFLDIYARNRIRHELIEKMSDEERQDMLSHIDKDNQELIAAHKQIDSLSSLTNSEILSIPSISYRLYLTKLAKKVASIFEVSNKVAKQIRKVLESDKPNVVMPVNKELNFIKEYDHCCFDYAKSETSYSFIIEKPDVLDNEYFYLDFTKDTSNRNVHQDDYPLLIRNAHSGDTIYISDYQVKVRRLFIDWKMPLSLRNRWPIIFNKDNKAIYIPRYQKNFEPDKECNFYVKKCFSLKK